MHSSDNVLKDYPILSILSIITIPFNAIGFYFGFFGGYMFWIFGDIVTLFLLIYLIHKFVR